jgi:hypothetical protein
MRTIGQRMRNDDQTRRLNRLRTKARRDPHVLLVILTPIVFAHLWVCARVGLNSGGAGDFYPLYQKAPDVTFYSPTPPRWILYGQPVSYQQLNPPLASIIAWPLRHLSLPWAWTLWNLSQLSIAAGLIAWASRQRSSSGSPPAH